MLSLSFFSLFFPSRLCIPARQLARFSGDRKANQPQFENAYQAQLGQYACDFGFLALIHNATRQNNKMDGVENEQLAVYDSNVASLITATSRTSSVHTHTRAHTRTHTRWRYP